MVYPPPPPSTAIEKITFFAASLRFHDMFIVTSAPEPECASIELVARIDVQSAANKSYFSEQSTKAFSLPSPRLSGQRTATNLWKNIFFKVLDSLVDNPIPTP